MSDAVRYEIKALVNPEPTAGDRPDFSEKACSLNKRLAFTETVGKHGAVTRRRYLD